MNKKDEQRLFYWFCKGVFQASASMEHKAKIIKEEIDSIEAMEE